ncbi:hypothetical protein FPZ42_01580 [Mucilaginibacter achroorhodeus]|uniref:Uncharacterized protein n=1 Tax=Mucilaginibacter achroorhodeus TaxID=2599294 RepID=A0A563U967_9SPHI|nr:MULTISPECIES: hypothetical protein [Mucilaginibacter]QXV67101.1 hypothetical protein INP83_08470 [Mucilaginibacter sp. 21P]TWR27932.1 hypothetical protein FPZ42_01580 [Mucilaginibacter achroorhodeus]
MKKLCLFVLPILLFATSCSKSVNSGCPTNQICTEIFASVGTQFVDANGKSISVTDLKVYNLRTKKYIEPKGIIDPGFSPMHYTIVTDSNRKELSSEGDDIRVTAMYGTKRVESIFKISGGCNCHVEKLSGPDKIVIK